MMCFPHQSTTQTEVQQRCSIYCIYTSQTLQCILQVHCNQKEVYTAATLYRWQWTCSIYCTPLHLYCTSVWACTMYHARLMMKLQLSSNSGFISREPILSIPVPIMPTTVPIMPTTLWVGGGGRLTCVYQCQLHFRGQQVGTGRHMSSPSSVVDRLPLVDTCRPHKHSWQVGTGRLISTPTPSVVGKRKHIQLTD